MDTKPKLAVLGLGAMGRAMAGCALRQGIATVVWNRDLDMARPLADQGAQVAVLARLAREWEQLAEQGLGNQDVTVVTRALES